MTLQTIVRFGLSCLLNWGQMIGIVPDCVLSPEEGRPFISTADASGKNRQLSHFPKIILILTEQDRIIGSELYSNVRARFSKH